MKVSSSLSSVFCGIIKLPKIEVGIEKNLLESGVHEHEISKLANK